jgi:hypothetical protein
MTPGPLGALLDAAEAYAAASLPEELPKRLKDLALAAIVWARAKRERAK